MQAVRGLVLMTRWSACPFTRVYASFKILPQVTASSCITFEHCYQCAPFKWWDWSIAYRGSGDGTTIVRQHQDCRWPRLAASHTSSFSFSSSSRPSPSVISCEIKRAPFGVTLQQFSNQPTTTTRQHLTKFITLFPVMSPTLSHGFDVLPSTL